MNKTKIMLGNEAIARGAYEAGVKVSSAYPGTPSTEISENIVNTQKFTRSGHRTKRLLWKLLLVHLSVAYALWHL